VGGDLAKGKRLREKMAEKPLHALLVEDNPGDVRLLREMLAGVTSPRFQLTHVAFLERALQHLEKGTYDAILLDLLLPDARGLEGFVRLQIHAPQIPVVVLTGVDDEALAVKAVRQGAQDYLVKGQFDGFLLARALRYAIERKGIELQLRRHRESLAELVEERTAELAQANEDLQREVEERKQAEKQIRAALREKEVLLQEVHHRVKNNLQVISSLLDMQSYYAQDPQAAHALQESQSRIKAMALVHERLYRSSDLASVDAREYIRSIADYLFGLYANPAKSIDLNVEVDDISLDLDTAIPCGLIANELISNALKYAFRNVGECSGEVRVALHSGTNDTMQLTVSDSGVGLPPGVTPATGQSLGLRLVHMLAQELGGTIELQTGEGTTITITFPKRDGQAAVEERC
jgi:two-component sensor histidine kinase/AmiR/NasT family two-component response regulator